MIGDAIKGIFGFIFNAIMLPVIIGIFVGLSVYVYYSIKKEFEISDIVYSQAYNEKYRFSSQFLQDKFDAWKRKKIKSGEIK